MFLFSKRELVIGLITASIGIFCILYFTENKSEAVSIPISKHVVVIDAGHGLPDRWRGGRRWNI